MTAPCIYIQGGSALFYKFHGCYVVCSGGLRPETCRRKRLFHIGSAVDTAVGEEGNLQVTVFGCALYTAAQINLQVASNMLPAALCYVGREHVNNVNLFSLPGKAEIERGSNCANL